MAARSHDLTLTVDPFEASATQTAGGIGDITVIPTMQDGYAGPPLAQLVWAQAVYANFSPGGGGQANNLDVYSISNGGNLAGMHGPAGPAEEQQQCDGQHSRHQSSSRQVL